MTDRDRLAADLHAEFVPQTHVHSEPCGVCLGRADRLIALGWTRNMTADDAAYEAGREDGLAEALDEEALERAALRVGAMPPELTFNEWTARIAKAYREDTE